MFKKRSSFAVLALSLALIVLGGMFSRASEPAKKPSVLIVSYSNLDRYSPEIFEAIHQAGFNVRYVNLRRPGRNLERMYRLLPKANVVMMFSSGEGLPKGTLDSKVQKYHDAINKFAKNGGGVFFVPSERYMNAFTCSAIFLKAWDAKLGVEYLYGVKPVEATAWRVFFAYTQDIKPSPLTKGVKGLWIPVIKEGVNFGSSEPSLGFQFGKSWQVLIKSGKNIFSKPAAPQASFLKSVTRKKGYKPGEAPIFAVRTFGKGRLAATAINWQYFMGHAVKSTLEEIVWSRGLQGKPSNGKQLVINTLRWLARPSLNDPKRGFATTKSLFRPDDKPPFAYPMNWDRRKFKKQVWKSMGGIIGARTAYSTGKGTVAEWKRAALKAGLDFLVFLEDFKHLTPKELEALNRDCKKLSDDKILLMPGFYAEDLIGCKSYFFNAGGMPYPSKYTLAKNGKVFGDANEHLGRRTGGKAPRVFRGQLDLIRMNWLWRQCSCRYSSGWFDFKNSPVPAADYGTFDSVPVFTQFADGKTEDSLKVYAETCRDKQYPIPSALEFMDSPDQLKRKNLWKNYVFADNMKELHDWYNDRQGGRLSVVYNRQWVSDGPKILCWDRLGGHDYTMTNKDEYVWQNALVKLFLNVSADAGIKEVRFWSGDKIIRRYKPSGKNFKTVMAVDKRREQYEIFVEVIDNQDRRAVTTPYCTRNHALQQINCGDRNNQLPCSHIRRRDGSVLKTWQMPATADKRVDYMSARPGLHFCEDTRLGLKAFDGSPRIKFPAVTQGLYLNTSAYHKLKNHCKQGRWTDEENGSHHIAVSVFNSMDALVGDRIVDSVFADNVDIIHVWSTRWKLQPREYSNWTQRRWVFRHRPDEPLLLFVWEYELKLKKDIQYKSGVNLGLLGPMLLPGDAQAWSVGPQGPGLKPSASGSYVKPDGRVKLCKPFGTGAWAACLAGKNEGGAIVFSLTDGLKIESYGNLRKPAFRIGFPPDKSPTKKGRTIKFKIAVIGVPRYVKGYTDIVAQTDPAAVPAAVKKSLGIGCKPLYKIKWEKGKPGKPDFVCPVTAENGVVLATFEKCPELIVPIPLMISGLNPNWTVAVYDFDLKQAREVGHFEGKAPYMVDPKYDTKRLFVGHPVQCGNPNLVIHAVQTGESQWTVEVHNPGKSNVSTRLKTVPEWPVFKLDRKISLSAGGTIKMKAGK